MSSPFSDQPEIVEFYDIIGRIVIAWGLIERGIDIVIWMGRPFDPEALSADQAPVAWNKKFKAFHRICRRHPKTGHLADWLDRHIQDIRQAAEVRHKIVHGYCHGIQNQEVPRIQFRAARFDPGEIKDKNFLASKAELLGYLRRLRDIERHMTMIVLALATQRHTKPETGE